MLVSILISRGNVNKNRLMGFRKPLFYDDRKATAGSCETVGYGTDSKTEVLGPQPMGDSQTVRQNKAGQSVPGFTEKSLI